MKLTQVDVIERLTLYYDFIDAAFHSTRVDLEAHLIPHEEHHHGHVNHSEFKLWHQSLTLTNMRKINSFSINFLNAFDATLSGLIPKLRHYGEKKQALIAQRNQFFHTPSEQHYQAVRQRSLTSSVPLARIGDDSHRLKRASYPRCLYTHDYDAKIDEINSMILGVNLEIDSALGKLRAAHEEFQHLLDNIEVSRKTLKPDALIVYLDSHPVINKYLREHLDDIAAPARCWLDEGVTLKKSTFSPAINAP